MVNIKEILIVGVVCVVGLGLLHVMVHFIDWLLEVIINFSGWWTLLIIFLFGCWLGYMMQKWPEDSKF